mgnify:CR=1 FL=1
MSEDPTDFDALASEVLADPVAGKAAQTRSVEITINNTPIHACPPNGSGIMPCCGCTPFEKMRDRITNDARLVTCGRK